MSNRDGDPADVLLVEDNPGDVRLTEEALAEGNIASTLHVVTDGVEALDFLYQRGEHADAPRPDVACWTSTSHGRTVRRYSKRCEPTTTSHTSRSSY